jgi:hypothetical protein
MGLWPLDFYFHRIKKKSKETSMIVLVNAMPQAGFFLLFK